MHGGSGKAAAAAARKRLQHLLPDTLKRLEQLRDQDDHKPTSMMAVKEILARTLGPVQGASGGGQTGPVINIGFLAPADGPPKVAVEVVEAEQLEDDELDPGHLLGDGSDEDDEDIDAAVARELVKVPADGE